jgi:hypothetical protein
MFADCALISELRAEKYRAGLKLQKPQDSLIKMHQSCLNNKFFSMKQNNEKQYAGVWLDNSKAVMITNNADSEAGVFEIQDKIKSRESHGGGSEHSMNNTKQSENLKYFKSLSSFLLNYDEILVFGPGKSQEQFQNFLLEDAQFKNKQITVETADQLTDPQMIARVRDFFKLSQS